MKKFIALFFAAALSSVALAQDNAADPVVISGAGISILQSEFEAAMKSLPQQYQDYAMGPGKKQFAEDFLRMKILAAAGKKAGLDRTPEVVQQLEMMRDNLVANAQLERIRATATVTEEELRAAYEAAKKEYEFAQARHVLIAFRGSPAAQSGKPELTEEEAKANAEAIRARLEQGESFDEIAKAESDDTGSGAQGGSLGEFSRGQMVPEFEEAAFGTAVGQLSPVVRTQFGYHVLRVDGRGTKPFEEVRAVLERAEKERKLQAALTRLIEEAKPTFAPGYFGH